MDTNVIAFFAHIKHDQIDAVLNRINNHKDSELVLKYLIGLETTDSVGEHMHFVITHLHKEGEKSQWYHNFSKWFKIKYNLCGKAKKGGVQQYKKLPDIRDLEKMEAYSVKDQNVYTNYTDEELKHLIDISYKKEDLKGYYTWFLRKLEEFEKNYETVTQQVILSEKKTKAGKHYHSVPSYNPIDPDTGNPYIWKSHNRLLHFNEDLKVYIIDLLKEKKCESITKAKVDSIFHRYITKHYTSRSIYHILFTNNIYKK